MILGAELVGDLGDPFVGLLDRALDVVHRADRHSGLR
jgi:hypothetical protein